ncbi:MAG: hypothetical protein ACO4CT_16630, partial [Planctomycetota bacterium]
MHVFHGLGRIFVGMGVVATAFVGRVREPGLAATAASAATGTPLSPVFVVAFGRSLGLLKRCCGLGGLGELGLSVGRGGFGRHFGVF